MSFSVSDWDSTLDPLALTCDRSYAAASEQAIANSKAR